jgi:mRNA interferase MazF
LKIGDIWLVDFSDAKGHEQRGDRPAIVVGSANGLIVVVPCTTTLSTARFSHTFSLTPTAGNGLNEESIALVFQIVALDRTRFRHQIGSITEHQRLAIVCLMRDLLKLD